MSTHTPRAATYRRVSTEGQRDNTSLEEQRRKTREEAERRGWAVVAEYADEGISGMSEARPAWQQMLNDARSGKFEYLIVNNTKRFARKSWHAIREMENLLELGVSLVSLQESFDLTTPAGRAMFGMSAVFANLDRDSIIENTVSGQRALARQGKLPGGEPPYGWRRNKKSQGGDGSVVPDGGEREILFLGYDLLVNRGMSCYEVVDWFNDTGIRPRWAERWNSEVVRNIWRNPTLSTGKLWWGVPKGQGGPRQRHSKTRLDPQGKPVWGDPVEIDLGEPVFNEVEHRAIVQALEKRSPGPVRSARSRMLSGRVFTAAGHRMYSVNTPRELWEGYYRCTSRRQSAGPERCQCPQFRAAPLEQLVWAEVSRLLSDPARLEKAARAYLALPVGNADKNADKQALDGVRASVAKLERALTKSERGVLMADTPADEKRQQAIVTELKSELAAANSRLAGYEALLASDEARGQALRDVAALAERARGKLHTMSEEDRTEVIRILQLTVVTTTPVMTGMPETVAISGVVDPRFWASDLSSAHSFGDASDIVQPASSAESNSRMKVATDQLLQAGSQQGVVRDHESPELRMNSQSQAGIVP